MRKKARRLAGMLTFNSGISLPFKFRPYIQCIVCLEMRCMAQKSSTFPGLAGRGTSGKKAGPSRQKIYCLQLLNSLLCLLESYLQLCNRHKMEAGDAEDMPVQREGTSTETVDHTLDTF